MTTVADRIVQTPLIAARFGRTLGTADGAEHLRGSYIFWICLIALALIVVLFLKETGRRLAVSTPTRSR
jgi:hypothetical protein